jgi:16S rRNA (adenine1518-N6/adenine1519-N6)-dimethyltransferase
MPRRTSPSNKSRVRAPRGVRRDAPAGPSTPLRAGVRPRRSLGQNFLAQTAVADRIVAAAALERGEVAVEIGPGLGILTERIAAHPIARLHTIELDEGLAARLAELFAGDRRVSVEHADFLEIDTAAIFAGGRVKVVGNLPFNVAAAILRKLCAHADRIERIVVMFQREVAERIRARPGAPGYSALSVFSSLYFDIESHFRVGAGNFHPRPKVDAEVLVMVPCATPAFGSGEEAAVLETVRAAFFAPRKTLRNALSHALRADPAQIAAALGAAGIDPASRAEEHPAAAFVRLARVLRGGLITIPSHA